MDNQIIDVSPRISGKTRRAVAWLKESPDRALLVIDSRRRDDLCQQYDLSREEAARIATFTDVLHGRPPLQNRPAEVFIDDADYYLEQLIRHLGLGRLAGFSASNDLATSMTIEQSIPRKESP